MKDKNILNKLVTNYPWQKLIDEGKWNEAYSMYYRLYLNPKKMKKEIISEWSKDWKGKYCYKCNSNENLENLTSSGWWAFYYRCNTCGSIYYLNYGDKMGGQADCLSSANMDDVNKDLLEHPEWYKI